MADTSTTEPARPAARTNSGRSRTSPGSRAAAGHGKAAAHKVKQKETVAVSLPGLGKVTLPHPQQLAFIGGIGVLAALEIIEWPAALALAVGHALVTQQHSRALEELGEALDEV